MSISFLQNAKVRKKTERQKQFPKNRLTHSKEESANAKGNKSFALCMR